VSVPPSLDKVKEYIGMEYKLPDCFKQDVDDADGEEDTTDKGFLLVNFLHDVDFDEDDIHVDPAQFGLVDTDVEPNDVFYRDLSLHLPEINPNRTTFKASIKRLMEQ
jgi:hypothetical protein